jgi:hypothetical protein
MAWYVVKYIDNFTFNFTYTSLHRAQYFDFKHLEIRKNAVLSSTMSFYFWIFLKNSTIWRLQERVYEEISKQDSHEHEH